MKIVDLFGRIIRALITMFIECIPALFIVFGVMFALTPFFEHFPVNGYSITERAAWGLALLFWYLSGIVLRNATRWLWSRSKI